MRIETTVWAVGNPLLADDGAGLEVVRLLGEKKLVGFSLRSCELAPGNYLGTIKREQPKNFILADASDMGLKPGEFRRFPLSRIDDPSFTSHDMPLDQLLHGVLPADCTAIVIAIQPANTGFHIGLTPDVAEAAARCSELIAEGRIDEISELD